MQGLATYESSDEDEEKTETVELPINGAKDNANHPTPAPGTDEKDEPHEPGSSQAGNEVLGPAQGPAIGPQSVDPPLPEDMPSREENPETTSRRIMQNLTLPPIPHVEIPPSPPRSPDPTTETNIQSYLEMKSQGIHLNKTLASKPLLRNPSLYSKLIDFAGIGEKEQYATSLTEDQQVGGLDGFDDSQYVENLEIDLRKRLQGAREDRDKDKSGKGKQQVAGTKRQRV